MNTLGWVGNYNIPGDLLSTLDDYGLQVTHDGQGRYAVRSARNGVKLENLFPDFVDREGETVDLASLKAFTEFLHQPVRKSLETFRPDIETPEEIGTRVKGYKDRRRARKDLDKNLHTSRTNIHRMLRFAATGSVKIPDDFFEGLEKYADDEHVKTEQAIRNKDSWRKARELGSDKQGIASVPNTSFDPENGFCFDLSANGKTKDGQFQNALDTKFWSLVGEATGGRYQDETSEIALSAKELQEFCRLADDPHIGELIAGAEFEEAVQARLKSVEARKKDFTNTLKAGEQPHSAEKLEMLMGASTALSPLISAPFMRDAWARHHFMERDEPPMDMVSKELAVFYAVADLYMQRGDVSAAEMEALATEFYSLFAFSGMAAKAFDDGLEMQARRDPEDQNISQLRESFQGLQKTFRAASAGDVDLNRKFLSEEQQNTLETIERFSFQAASASQKAKSAVAAPVEAGAETFKSFVGDIVNFIRQDPKIATGFLGFSALMYKLNEKKCSMTGFNEAGDMIQIPYDCDYTDGMFEESFHWDFGFKDGVFKPYKHFANTGWIQGPAQWLSENVREGVHGLYRSVGLPTNPASTFEKVADSTIKPVGDALFGVNLFQNFSHVGFWMWSVSKGWNNGADGVMDLMKLSAPLVDLGAQVGANIVDPMSKKDPLHSQIMNAGSAEAHKPCYVGSFCPAGNGELMEELGEVAVLKAEIEQDLPEDIQPYEGELSIYQLGNSPKARTGLKRAFKISSENYRPTLEALEKLDHVMAYAAGHLGVKESWQTRTVVEGISEIREALQTYRQDGDGAALGAALDQHLEKVIGSELFYRGGRSNVHEAIFEAAPDQQALKLFLRGTSARMGREKRDHICEDARQIRAGKGENALSLTGHAGQLARAGRTRLWGGMVNTARMLQRGADKTINKRNIAIAGGVAAASTGLDLAGVSTVFTDSMSGATAASLVTSAEIAGLSAFTFIEDIVLVHIGSGTALIIGGAGAGELNRRGLLPGLKATFETKAGQAVKGFAGDVGQACVSAADGVTKLVTFKKVASLKDGVEEVKKLVAKGNQSLGDHLTERVRLRVDAEAAEPDL